VVIDDGAVRAVVESHKSLLPAGVIRAEGSFAPGDVIAVRDAQGREVARGLTNYSSVDITRIAGKRSDEVRALLSGEAFDEVIHRDNMAKA
jgi:glutamate 5-kinase